MRKLAIIEVNHLMEAEQSRRLIEYPIKAQLAKKLITKV
jgi:hypothetical protein